jgi:kumamolisin
VLTNANEWMTKRPLDFDIKEKKFVGDSNQQKQRNRMIVLTAGAFAVFAISFLLIKAHIFSPANKSVSLQKDSVQAHSNTNDTVQADLPQQDKENITTDPKLGYTSFTAPQLAKLYNFPAELDGTGQTIGIIELGGGFRESDLNKYFSDLKIRKPSITVVSVDSATNHPAPDADNQPTLDIEVAGAVAPAAHLVIYFAPSANDGFIDAINAAVSDSKNHPSIIFICWGNAEMNWSASTITQLNSLFQNGSERGITILAAAGDTGPGDGVTDGQAHVDFPASSPYVLACGGTKIVAANDKVVAETVWNSGDNSATGGGISHFFSLPEWQKNNKGVFLKGRSIPDVSANADPASGYRIRVDGRNVVIGGTSAVVPLWAGLIALINQGIGKNAGYINPLLYTKIGPSGVLRDITIGDNKSGSFGYSATIGWDACTGWGSPDGRKLLNALKAAIK